MGKVKRNLLMSILLLVVMGIFAVLTIYVVIDAINKKYYEDLNVDYEVQEEEGLNNLILTFARNEGSKINNSTIKAVRNPDNNNQFRLDGVVPIIENGTVTNLDAITNENGGEFYFFSTNPAFIDVQETPEDPNLIFSETDARYYVSTEENPIWYDIPSENVFTLHAVFLTPNVHNADFESAPLLNTDTNVIISHDVVSVPYNAFSDLKNGEGGSIESVVLPNSVRSIESNFSYVELLLGELSGMMGDEASLENLNFGGAFAGCTTLTDIIIPSSVEYIGGEAFMMCTGLKTNLYNGASYVGVEGNPYGILTSFEQNLASIDIHEDCISIQGTIDFMASEGDRNTTIENIIIPKNVTSIGLGTFSGFTMLQGVLFEEGSNLVSLGDMVFCECSSLKSINLEDTSLEKIGGMLFVGSTIDSITLPEIDSITLPETINNIGSGAFAGTQVNNISIVGDNEYYDIINNSLVETETKTLIQGTNASVIPTDGSVTSIGVMAFAMTGITSIDIPECITSVGFGAFMNCESLDSVTVADVTCLGQDENSVYLAFAGAVNITEITVHKGDMSVLPLSQLPEIKNVTIGEGVTSIGKAFRNCDALETVTFLGESQIETIVDEAFYNCRSLTSITIPESVTSIGSDAFYNCTGLTAVTFEEGSGLSSIGSSAFRYCNNLTSITIPESVTSIGDWAFSYCTGLTTVTFEEGSGLSSIGSYAFYNCTSLTSITIPSTVTSIGSYAFTYCTGLTSITFEDVTGLYEITSSVFIGCSRIETLTILSGEVKDVGFSNFTSSISIAVILEEGVTSIGSDAFYNCRNLTSIKIPESVTSIGSDAFYNCTNIQELHIDDITSYLNISFGNSYSYPLYYTNQSVSLYVGKELVTALEIPNEVTTIPNYAFRHCNFTSVTIPKGVTSIGSYAFSYCTGLTSITFEDVTGLSEITSSVFSGCSSIETLTILSGEVKDVGFSNFTNSISIAVILEEGVTSIGERAFYNCDSLTSITIPSSVTSIGGSAFSGCIGLTTVTFEDMTGLTEIGSSVFSVCRNVETLTILSGEVKDLDFSYFTNLTTVTLGEGVTSIGSSAFSGCSSLTSITIPSSVTSIGSNAFYNCIGLTTVTFEEGSKLSSIGEYAFSGCRGLTSIKIPEGVTSIGNDAFYGCYRLVEVYNLSSLNIEAKSSSNGYIGYYAIEIKESEESGIYTLVENNEFVMYKDLAGNHYLVNYLGSDTEIVLPTLEGGQTYSINDYAFYNNDNITSITIQSIVTSIESYAFYSCNSLTSITIPSSVTSIGNRVFYYCTGLTTVTFEEGSGLTNIGIGAFEDCSSLTSITLPEGITTINDDTFAGCSALINITIPSSVTSIGDVVFSRCSSLTSITIPSGVISIGRYAFEKCDNFTSITIPNSVKDIKSYAFDGCDNLTIYCEVESKPSGWSSSWNDSDRPVYWGLNVNWKYDEVTREPRPI